jgi:hypothetical protein
MTEIIEHNDSGNGRAISVGDSHSQVSLKVYQDIYHQVTGRTEQIRKRYSENLLIDFQELQQLHHKITQLCDVHHIVVQNAIISVFHEKERKEQFTSFERFKAYNSNATSPTVSVVLKYNFSIVPAGVERPQEYVVTIRLTSRIAAMKQIEEGAPPFMRGRLFGFFAGNVAEVTIDYADYIIARGFLEGFQEWVSGCKANPKSKLLQVLRHRSHWIPTVLQLAVASIIISFTLQSIHAIIPDAATLGITARFMVIFAGCSYILLKLIRITGDLIEQTIDNFPEISYLNLNKGDEKLIKEAESNKPMALLRIAIGAAGTIALGIISSKLEKLM